MKKVLFIYNPSSGENKILKELDTVIKIHQKYGMLVDIVRIDENINLSNILCCITEDYVHILVAGGDGSVDSVVNQLMRYSLDIPIGILPMGTANDYARYIGMPSNVEEACRQILTLPSQKMDVGKVNDSYFINVLSAGYFTDISQKTNDELKHSIGKFAYFLKSFELFKDVKRTKVKITSEEFNYDGDMFIIMIFNGISSGGLNMAYKSVGNDGLLDVIVFNGTTSEMVSLALKILRGDHLENPVGIEYFRTSKMCIECDEDTPTDIDGEKGPSYPLNVECISKRLTVLGVKSSI